MTPYYKFKNKWKFGRRGMRSLGVIFLADVVGYSKMMAQDEPGTLEKLRNFAKDVIRPTLEKHSGNMIKSLGGWVADRI